MPYIKDEDKKLVALRGYASTPGELNYLITKNLLQQGLLGSSTWFMVTVCCEDYWKNSKKNYQAINDVIGALECAKYEYIRRMQLTSYQKTYIRRRITSI